MNEKESLKISDTEYYNNSIERLANEANNSNEYAEKRMSPRELKERFMRPAKLFREHFNDLVDLLDGLDEEGKVTKESILGLIHTGIPSLPTLYDLVNAFPDGNIPDAILIEKGKTLKNLIRDVSTIQEWITGFEAARGITVTESGKSVLYKLIESGTLSKLVSMLEAYQNGEIKTDTSELEQDISDLQRWVEIFESAKGLPVTEENGAIRIYKLIQSGDLSALLEMLGAYQRGEIGSGDTTSPTAKVEQTTDGAKITITDKDGTTVANVANGKDGISPVVTTERTTDGVQIKVTDASGETSVTTVYDGEDGKDGTDGYTPEIKLVPVTDGVQIQVYGQNSSSTATIRNGTDGKSAYAYAQDGGYAGTEAEFAEKLAAEMPEKLPNPHALTINGVEYDGSEAVDIEITGGSTSENSLIGQTPITLSEDTTIRMEGTGEVTYTIQSGTVADVSTATSTSVSATMTQTDDYIEFKSTGGAAWYVSHVDLTMGGLVVGEKYRLIIDLSPIEFDTANNITDGHYILKDSSGTTLITPALNGSSMLHNYEFTATTEKVTLICYPAGNSTFVSGKSISRAADIYINRSVAGSKKSKIVNTSGTFTDSYVIGAASSGTTISSDPSCYVYKVVSSGGEGGGADLPLAGREIVCFGDSLFGMFRGTGSAPAYAAKYTGATVYNVGFGGCRMSTHPYVGYNEFCMWALAKAIAEGDWSAQDAAAAGGSDYFPEQLELLKGIDFNAVDSVVIHYGTNDFAAGVSVDNESDPDDYTTLCGALRYSIEKLLGAYPKLKIFVSLPVFRYWTASDGTVTYSDTYLSNGKTLPVFVEALRAVALEYNLPVIDGYYGMGINKDNASAFLSDGTHHNADGRKRFGEFIGAHLTSFGQTATKSGEGGSASIEVTAEVGQTIVVEEVDADGKPTKWSAADYQPRTHWKAIEKTEIFPQRQVFFEETQAIVEEFIPLITGSTYTVTFNGGEYQCECIEMEQDGTFAQLLGNLILTGGEDTGEPFCVLNVQAQPMICFVDLTGSISECEVSVYGPTLVTHKLDNDYIDKEYLGGIAAQSAKDELNNSFLTTHAADIPGVFEFGQTKSFDMDTIDFSDYGIDYFVSADTALHQLSTSRVPLHVSLNIIGDEYIKAYITSVYWSYETRKISGLGFFILNGEICAVNMACNVDENVVNITVSKLASLTQTGE